MWTRTETFNRLRTHEERRLELRGAAGNSLSFANRKTRQAKIVKLIIRNKQILVFKKINEIQSCLSTLNTKKKRRFFPFSVSGASLCDSNQKQHVHTITKLDRVIGLEVGGIIGQHVAIVSTWRGPGGSTISLFILGALYYMHTSRHLFLKDLITRITMTHFVCFLFDHRFQWQLISFFLWLMSTCSPLKTQVERRSVHYFSILKKYVEMREGKKTCWHRAWWRTSCNMYQRIINDFIPSHHFSFFPRKKTHEIFARSPKGFCN